MILFVFLFLLLQLLNDRRLEIEFRKKSTMQQKMAYKLEPYLISANGLQDLWRLYFCVCLCGGSWHCGETLN